MNILRAELLKLLTLRGVRLTLMLGLVAEAIFALLVPLLASSRNLAELDMASLLSGTGLVSLLVPVTGALIVAGEFRHGTAGPTFLAVPHRGRVFAAKVMAAALFGAVVALVFIAINAACAVPTLHSRGITVPADEALKVYLGIVIGHALSGALGAGIGGALRNQVAAIGLIAALFFVLGGLAHLIGEPARYSPPLVLGALQGIAFTDPEGLRQMVAGAVYAAYTVIAVALGFTVTRSRDVLG